MTGPKCFLRQSPSATRPAVPYLRVFLLLTGLAIPFTGARAQEDEALVKYRQMIMKTLGVNMGALAEIAQSGDGDAIGAQVKKVGEACGACHKPFRKPKEERFQR